MEKKYWNLSLAAVAGAVIFFAALIVISQASKPAPQPPMPPTPTEDIAHSQEVQVPAEIPATLLEKLPDVPPVAAAIEEKPAPIPQPAVEPPIVVEPQIANVLKIAPAAAGSSQNVVEFFQNGKKLFDLKFKSVQTPGAMLPASVSADKKSYYFQEFSGKEIDCKKFALDIKGDKKSQYMIVVNKSDDDYEGFLIDLKQGVVLGNVPAAETVEYPINNPDLVFEFSETVVQRNAGEQDVCLKVKFMLRENQEPLCVSQVQTTFDLEKFKVIPTDRKDRNDHLARLYCELANAGMIRYAIRYARSIGYSDAEVLHVGGQILDMIRSSELYPHIKKLNNDLP